MVNIVGETVQSYTGKSEVPIGFVYIQFPNKPEPSTIFTGTWGVIRSGAQTIGSTVSSSPYICMSATSSSSGNHCHCYRGSVTSSTAGAHTHPVTLTTSLTAYSVAYGITVKVWKRLS